jgi:hypothetical protein
VLHLYTVFFSHRLTDFPSVIPSLHALTALVQKYADKFEPRYGDAHDMFQSVFRSLVVPSYAQTVRHKVYLLFKALLSHDSLATTLVPHGKEILDGIVSAMEEEKDPRCLLEVFRVLHLAMGSFPTNLTDRVAVIVTDEEGGEDMKADVSHEMQLSARVFEALNCYFPITFSPPPNDPFGITSEMLVSALEDCLCTTYDADTSNTLHAGGSASSKRKLEQAEALGLLQPVSADPSAMVRQSVPYFLEQLSSDLYTARVHALRALLRIVRTSPYSYGVFGLLPPQDGENSAATGSGKKPSKLSAQDRALMDMVDMDGEGYADMYIQDAAEDADGVATDASAFPWSPVPNAAYLLRSLSALSERLYGLLTGTANAADVDGPPPEEEEEGKRGTRELVVHGLTLIGAMTSAMTETGKLHPLPLALFSYSW